MGYVIALPILLILIILQTTFAKQITLLGGSVDLILIWLAAWGIQGRVNSIWFWTVSAIMGIIFVSAIPWYVIVLSYASVAIISQIIVKRFWQSPLLGMFTAIIIGSLVLYISTFLSLVLAGVALSWKASLVDVIIPSTLLNLLFSLPVYVIAKDTAQWVYPVKVAE
jgi:hypothetical protein